MPSKRDDQTAHDATVESDNPPLFLGGWMPSKRDDQTAHDATVENEDKLGGPQESWVSIKRDEQSLQDATVENVNIEAPGNQWWHAGRDVQSS